MRPTYDKGVYSGFTSYEADFEEDGHVMHENDLTIEGYMIEDEINEANVITGDPLTGYIDDCCCIYCKQSQDRTRARWHVPNFLYNPVVQREEAIRHDERMLRVGVAMRPRDIIRQDTIEVHPSPWKATTTI
jgi:hypothetical protein